MTFMTLVRPMLVIIVGVPLIASCTNERDNERELPGIMGRSEENCRGLSEDECERRQRGGEDYDREYDDREYDDEDRDD